MVKPTRKQLVNLAVELVEEAMHSLSNPGICIECGECCEGVEPDAEEYPCYNCEQIAVYGAEQILIMFG